MNFLTGLKPSESRDHSVLGVFHKTLVSLTRLQPLPKQSPSLTTPGHSRSPHSSQNILSSASLFTPRSPPRQTYLKSTLMTLPSRVFPLLSSLENILRISPGFYTVPLRPLPVTYSLRLNGTTLLTMDTLSPFPTHDFFYRLLRRHPEIRNDHEGTTFPTRFVNSSLILLHSSVWSVCRPFSPKVRPLRGSVPTRT